VAERFYKWCRGTHEPAEPNEEGRAVCPSCQRYIKVKLDGTLHPHTAREGSRHRTTSAHRRRRKLGM